MRSRARAWTAVAAVLATLLAGPARAVEAVETEAGNMQNLLARHFFDFVADFNVIDNGAVFYTHAGNPVRRNRP